MVAISFPFHFSGLHIWGNEKKIDQHPLSDFAPHSQSSLDGYVAIPGDGSSCYIPFEVLPVQFSNSRSTVVIASTLV